MESELLALATGIPIVTTTISEYFFSLQLRVCASSLCIHTGVSWEDATFAKSWKVESTRVTRASLALIKSPIAQLLSSSVGSNSTESMKDEVAVMRRNAPETQELQAWERYRATYSFWTWSLRVCRYLTSASVRTRWTYFGPVWGLHRLPSCLKTHWQNNGDTGREFEFDVGECEVWLLRNWIVKPREVFTELSKSHWFKRLDEDSKKMCNCVELISGIFFGTCSQPTFTVDLLRDVTGGYMIYGKSLLLRLQHVQVEVTFCAIEDWKTPTACRGNNPLGDTHVFPLTWSLKVFGWSRRRGLWLLRPAAWWQTAQTACLQPYQHNPILPVGSFQHHSGSCIAAPNW